MEKKILSSFIRMIICGVILIGCSRERPLDLESKKQVEKDIPPIVSKEDQVFRDDRSPHILRALERYQLPDPLVKPFFENHLESSFISNVENLLRKQEVLADKELSLFLYLRLGIVYSSKKIKDFEKALFALNKAVTIASTDKDRFRSQLAMSYRFLCDVFEHLGKYNEAINVSKTIVTECQGAGTGKYKNMIAAAAISDIARYSQIVEKDTENLKRYLIETANANNNTEIGYAALSQLYDLSKKEGNQVNANFYLQKMESYPAAWEYRRHSDHIIEKWQRIESQKQFRSLEK